MCDDYRVFRVDFGTKFRFNGCIWSVIVLRTMEGGRIEMNLGRQVDWERYISTPGRGIGDHGDKYKLFSYDYCG